MYKTFITLIAAYRLRKPISEIKQWIEFDFEGEPCPSVNDLIEHIQYQETVCMADNPTEAFLSNY